MEESQKRRERLKAMRIEAANTAVNADTDSLLASGGLSNPLVEGESTSIPTKCFSPRFDYYTDPMAAFSGSRRDNITPQVSHGHFNMLPRPTHQNMSPGPTYQGMTPNQSYQPPGVNHPDQRIFQAPGANFNQSPLGRPMELAGRPQGVNRPDQRIFQVPGAHFNQSPLGQPMELAGRPQGNPPNAWGGPGALNYTSPSNMSRGRHFGNRSFGQEDHPYYGRGRGQNYYSSNHASGHGGSRHPEPGRGRGLSLGNSTTPGSRMSGRRGGSHEYVSAEERPDLYYKKEMVEDPWKMLTPIIAKDTHAQDTDKSWLPKSITMKKAKVSTEDPQTSISQQSLAQYLASSFSDSTDEPVHNEPST
ncbi:protein SICKLE isoform X2 [Salvia miltiorrhiza]|uniref:protein SICKLE isoform X2 n=1 Tax=Salvia miltiorrhiza TaxID=226208 RepID=UPI0025AB85BE|nr:protein SICKLE isoform X2 [Salvia miltiorrhiza]XP_057793954.1 protein SICKLE isoform X2 [Salvia miltiorrhiza]